MKRSMITSGTRNEESLHNHGDSKKRKRNNKNEEITSEQSKDSSNSNQSNLIPISRETQGTNTRIPNSISPNHSNGLTLAHSSWSPQWGYQHAWATSRNNLNYHSFESTNDSCAQSSSKFNSHTSFSPNPIQERNGVSPISFISLESKFVPNIPSNTDFKGTNSKFEKIAKDIWVHFKNYQQSGKIFHQKVELWNELERVLRRRFRCATHVFGSTLNGFGSHESDMDLCMFNGQVKSKKGKDDVRLLAEVRRAIRRECSSFISGNIELVPAKIPILKFYDQYGKIEVDLSCNNQTSVRNTNLLFCYSQVDWRVRPLVLAVKDWAKAVGINEARFSTISSYCLTLMVLHFLQAGVKDPVVPNLHQLHPDVFHPNSDIFDLPFNCDIEPSFKSQNKSSLGELLHGFFQYYTKDFDFANHVGSIRAGKRLFLTDCENYAKEKKISPGQWKAYVLMEEPFDRSNAGRAICKRDKFDLILKAFEAANEAVDNGKNFKYLLEENEIQLSKTSD